MVPDSVQPRRTLPRQISASVTFATFLRPKWRLQSGGNLRYDQDTKLTCLHQTFMQSVSNGTLPLWSNRILIAFLCLSCTANKLNCYNMKRIPSRDRYLGQLDRYFYGKSKNFNHLHWLIHKRYDNGTYSIWSNFHSSFIVIFFRFLKY